MSVFTPFEINVVRQVRGTAQERLRLSPLSRGAARPRPLEHIPSPCCVGYCRAVAPLAWLSLRTCTRAQQAGVLRWCLSTCHPYLAAAKSCTPMFSETLESMLLIIFCPNGIRNTVLVSRDVRQEGIA